MRCHDRGDARGIDVASADPTRSTDCCDHGADDVCDGAREYTKQSNNGNLNRFVSTFKYRFGGLGSLNRGICSDEFSLESANLQGYSPVDFTSEKFAATLNELLGCSSNGARKVRSNSRTSLESERFER